MKKNKIAMQRSKQTENKMFSNYKRIIRFIGNKLNNIPVIKRSTAKYPRLFQFILNRLSIDKFDGLPLTLLITVFIANLLVFNEIAESIVNSKWMLSIDHSLAESLFNIRTDAVANSLFYFTKLASTPVVIFVALVAICIFVFQRKYIYIISLLIALIGAGFSSYLGKIYFHRIRPDNFSFYTEPSYSFPSGHAIFAVAFYGLLSYFFIRNKKKHKFQWAIITLLFVLLLGFSRLYLGVHYLSDVLAGYSLGLLWLLFSVSIIEWEIPKAYL